MPLNKETKPNQLKVYSLLQFLSCRREKMKYESTTEQKETCQKEKESRDRLEVSCWFSVVILKYLFDCLIFTGSRLEPTPKWGQQLSTIFTLFCLGFTRIFTFSCREKRTTRVWKELALLSNPSRPLFSCLLSEGEPYPFLVVTAPLQKFWCNSFFFSHF